MLIVSKWIYVIVKFMLGTVQCVGLGHSGAIKDVKWITSGTIVRSSCLKNTEVSN